jgi:hypothetical protein
MDASGAVVLNWATLNQIWTMRIARSLFYAYSFQITGQQSAGGNSCSDKEIDSAIVSSRDNGY